MEAIFAFLRVPSRIIFSGDHAVRVRCSLLGVLPLVAFSWRIGIAGWVFMVCSSLAQPDLLHESRSRREDGAFYIFRRVEVAYLSRCDACAAPVC